MISWMIGLYTKTIAKMNWPFSQKRFDLSDLREIEGYLKDCKLAVILVTTYGSGSNLGIKIAQRIGTKNRTKKTHAALSIGFRDGVPMVVEAVGGGVQVVPLVWAIGQRDEVMIREPSKLLNSRIQDFMLEYLNDVIKRDGELNIPYDEEHNLEDASQYDCAELAFHTLVYGFRKAGHLVSLKPVMRLGKKTFTPIELEYSELFDTVYDNGWSD